MREHAHSVSKHTCCMFGGYLAGWAQGPVWLPLDRIMAPKAKVKAAPKANVQSKDMVKSVSKDKKVGKGKAKCQAKANAQGKAQGKAKAKAEAKGAAPDREVYGPIRCTGCQGPLAEVEEGRESWPLGSL